MVGSTVVDAFDADAAVPLMKALADPTRLRIVALLGAGPRCVCSLQEEVDVAANLLSHHLRVLREAGLIAGARRGRWIDYRLRAEALDGTLRFLAGLRDGAPASCCANAGRTAVAQAAAPAAAPAAAR
jgi:ArsR family transcriptional regulator, arsenate/arsenite/antimonite-responsive transcriptional repressor